MEFLSIVVYILLWRSNVWPNARLNRHLPGEARYYPIILAVPGWIWDFLCVQTLAFVVSMNWLPVIESYVNVFSISVFTVTEENFRDAIGTLGNSYD